mgnify:CR=1 FL=1
MDRLGSGGVSSGELGVEHGDGVAESGGSILLVHVNVIVSCKISNKDSVVLDGLSFLLKDLAD